MGEGVNSDFISGGDAVKEISFTENELIIKGKLYCFYELPVSTDYVATLVME
jgi:hypothetical protein